MRKYFRGIVLLTVICFSCFIVSGCIGKHETADKSIKTYCEAMLHMNHKSLKKLNISPSKFKKDVSEKVFGVCNLGIFSKTQMDKIGMACSKK